LKETKKCYDSRQLNTGHLPKDRVELEGYAGARSISMTSEGGRNDRNKYQYGLLEKIVSPDNLREAFRRVKATEEATESTR
jgi:RNA-directed DNA polymerase